MDSVEDIYKAIGNELNNSLNCEWDKIELTIECSNDYVGTSAKYQINGEWKNNLDCDLTRDTMISIIKFHNNAGKINFTPWNKAVYTLEKNGHFDMTFEWNQSLQDKWDNA